MKTNDPPNVLMQLEAGVLNKGIRDSHWPNERPFRLIFICSCLRQRVPSLVDSTTVPRFDLSGEQPLQGGIIEDSFVL